MGSISTAMTTSFKQELLEAGHCFNGTVTPTGSAASGSTAVTSVSSMTGVVVGMGVTGTNIPANTVVAATTSSTAFTLSQATTGVITGGTLTIAGDVFKIALVKTSPAGTFGAASTNYSNLGADEVASGAGYTTGGNTLVQTSPTSTGTTAFLTFANTSWTTASFSCTGAMIYNTSERVAGVTNRAVSCHSIGDTTVSSGTLTLVFPTFDATSAILRLV